MSQEFQSLDLTEQPCSVAAKRSDEGSCLPVPSFQISRAALPLPLGSCIFPGSPPSAFLLLCSANLLHHNLPGYFHLATLTSS